MPRVDADVGAYVRIRPHTSAYVRVDADVWSSLSAYVGAYVSIRPHTSAYVRVDADVWSS
jgi:hypothetical protein